MKTLKKLTAMVCFLIGVFTFANAQISLGLRAGTSLATAHFDKENLLPDSPDYYWGTTAGIVAEVCVVEFFALQTEAGVIQKGYKMNHPFNAGNKTITTHFDYLEIPLLLKMKYGSETVKGFVMAGPYYAYALNGRAKLAGEKSNKIDFDQANIQRHEWGGVFGVGIGAEVGPGTLFLDSRFEMGFTNLDNQPEAVNTGWYNRGFNIGLGYMVAIGEVW